jgi:hypothetical protein
MPLTTIKVIEDAKQHAAFRTRGFKGIVKRTLQQVMAEQHNRYIKRHFTRQAYSLYRFDYPKRKKAGLPFVKSGTMRDRLTQRRGVRDVRGTSRTAHLVVKFGRPPQYTQTDINRKIRILMVAKNMTYQQARGQVMRKAGYSAKVKRQIQRGATALNGGEARSLRKFMHDTIVFHMQASGGRKRRRTIR